MDKEQKTGCAAGLCSIFLGFFLGFLFCLLICLCSGCRSQKSVTTSVAVDSTAMSATTEIEATNTEATSMQNFSLHFDTLEMWLAPDINSFSQFAALSPTPDREGSETAEKAVSFPFFSQNTSPMVGGVTPIYIRATGATIGSESAASSKSSETKVSTDSTSTDVSKKEDSHEDVDRTAVSKPPNTTLIIITCVAMILALLAIQRYKR
ncbi:MAG: hypothetical protein IKW83_12260 [Muribaculaceae bacterium]|nr:hypothetical protein [Muribaculaceae bacterium]